LRIPRPQSEYVARPRFRNYDLYQKAGGDELKSSLPLWFSTNEALAFSE
jgi:hypothetical protein